MTLQRMQDPCKLPDDLNGYDSVNSSAKTVAWQEHSGGPLQMGRLIIAGDEGSRSLPLLSTAC